MSIDANPLLESYLKDLRLPAFMRHYRKVAEDAAQANLGYDRYLLSLAEQEIAQREKNRQIRLSLKDMIDNLCPDTGRADSIGPFQ